MTAASIGTAPAAWPEQTSAPGTCRIAEGEAIIALRDEWMAFAGCSIVDNIFFDAGFAIPAIAHLHPSGIGVALTHDVRGGPLAVAPFTRTRLGRIAPAVRLWGNKYAPLGVPLLAGDDPVTALDSLVQGLVPASSGRSLIVPDVETDSPVAAALVAIAEDGDRPLTALHMHERALLTRQNASIVRGQGGSHRKGLRRMLRRLEDLGEVSFDVATQTDTVGARLEEFLAIEQAGWKGRRGTALTSTGATAAFAREAVLGLAAVGRARVHSLRLDDQPIAALISFIAGATAYTWKIAYDEAYARFSPGVQLIARVPEQLFDNAAVQRIDSCAGADHAMIERFWPERLAIASYVLGPPGGGAVHAVGLAAARAELAARASARQLLNRR